MILTLALVGIVLGCGAVLLIVELHLLNKTLIEILYWVKGSRDGRA